MPSDDKQAGFFLVLDCTVVLLFALISLAINPSACFPGLLGTVQFAVEGDMWQLTASQSNVTPSTLALDLNFL